MALGFRSAAQVSVQSTTASLSIPAPVQVGDRMFALIQTGSITGTLSTPAGWTALGAINNGTTWYSQLVTKIAVVGDLGGSVAWATPGAGIKSSILFSAYSGGDAADSFDVMSFLRTSSASSHASASVTTTDGADWILGMYLERGTAPVITPPGAFALRATATQTGGGAVSGVAVDSNGPVSIGSQNAGTYTSNLTNNDGVIAVIAVKAASAVVSTAEAEAFDSYAEGLLRGEFDSDTDTYKMILMSASYTFDKDSHVFYSDVSAGECATSNGYTAGGKTVAFSMSTDAVNHRKIWDIDPVTWDASGGNLPSTIGAVIFKSTGSAATSRLIWWIPAGGTISDADVALTVAPDPTQGVGYLETPSP